jgi:tetratricopeptide (TPR) repeat protein
MDWKFAQALAEARSAKQARAASREARGAAQALYGYYLMQTGRPAEALVEYQIGERAYPSFPTLHHHLGHPYFVWRRFDEALKYYQDSIDLEPRHVFGYYWKGRVYEETTNYLAAIQEFERSDLLAGRNETNTRAFYSTLRDAIQPGGAGYWNKRLELALKDSTQDLYYIATLYARLGDKPTAYKWLKQACEKKAFNEGPLFDLCWDRNDTNFLAIVSSIGLLQ